MTTKQRQSRELGPICSQAMARIDPVTGYISNIDEIRRAEYPTLHGILLLFAIVAVACD
jgi:hypothetical protein